MSMQSKWLRLLIPKEFTRHRWSLSLKPLNNKFAAEAFPHIFPCYNSLISLFYSVGKKVSGNNHINTAKVWQMKPTESIEMQKLLTLWLPILKGDMNIIFTRRMYNMPKQRAKHFSHCADMLRNTSNKAEDARPPSSACIKRSADEISLNR